MPEKKRDYDKTKQAEYSHTYYMRNRERLIDHQREYFESTKNIKRICMNRWCPRPNRVFYINKVQLRQGKGKYCSRHCYLTRSSMVPPTPASEAGEHEKISTTK